MAAAWPSRWLPGSPAVFPSANDLRWLLVIVGTIPFALLTWWSLIPVVLALLAAGLASIASSKTRAASPRPQRQDGEKDMSNRGTPGSTASLDRSSERPGAAQLVGFLVVFLAAWFALDRLVPNPLLPFRAVIALLVAGAIVFVGQAVVFRTEPARIPAALGLGRPAGRALVVAVLVGGLVIAFFLIGAALLGIQLRLKPEWPAVLLAALIFHGIAEELVWRGYAFARIREHRTFWRAVLLSIPLIAATHVPIIVTNGWLVGGLALLTASVTCLPFAYLWERGGRTIWAPAILHGLIGSWQIFDRSYPVTFSLVVLIASILVPLIAFAFRDNFFGASVPDREHWSAGTT